MIVSLCFVFYIVLIESSTECLKWWMVSFLLFLLSFSQKIQNVSWQRNKKKSKRKKNISKWNQVLRLTDWGINLPSLVELAVKWKFLDMKLLLGNIQEETPDEIDRRIIRQEQWNVFFCTWLQYVKMRFDLRCYYLRRNNGLSYWRKKRH